MPKGFPGFPAEAITFFRGLARNNNRDWFQPRKPIFDEKVKRPMTELVEAVNLALKDFAPDHVTDPGKAIYRLYRDTRFSKNKTPYKDHIAASFPRRGLVQHEGAGYYFAVSHKEVAVGGGMYMPLPDTLRSIRNHIAEHHTGMRRILAAKNMRTLFGDLQGEQLSRPPKGFAKDHPAGDLLRYKQLFHYVELPPDQATTPELYETIRKYFRTLSPLIDYLNSPLVQAKKAQDRTKMSSEAFLG